MSTIGVVVGLYALLTDDVVRCFAGSDFTAKDLLFSKKPVTVYLRWHESDLLSLAPLIKFVWESLMNELITAYDHAPNKDTCQPVLLSIEEAGRTGIPNLPEHSSTVNGRHISITAVFQSLAQMDALYGQYRTRTFLNNRVVP
jgi:type IV secretory pathway TraG/TraD family ATPase VirD4